MIYKTITNDYEFAEWVKQSDSYSNNFTFEGAKALQEYLEQLSDDISENIEFDPIAWCCEYSEYKGFNDWQKNFYGIDDTPIGSIKNLDELQDNTTVIEFDGGIIVQDF